MSKHKHRWQCIDCGAVKCAAVKPVKNKRGQSGYHDAVCYCSRCFPIRHEAFLLAQGAWVAEHPEIISWYGNLIETAYHNMNSAPVVKLESIADIEARLSVCACGHIASTHDQDALGNLLSCTARNCKCDHFHYDAGKVAA